MISSCMNKKIYHLTIEYLLACVDGHTQYSKNPLLILKKYFID